MPIILAGTNIQRSGTLLDLIQNASRELGLPVPEQIIGSRDPQVSQMLAIVRRLGKDLVREFEWQQLITMASITTSAGILEYDLPAGWNRQIPQTEWNRTQSEPLLGPATSQQWQLYRAWTMGATTRTPFRILNNKIVLLNSPADGDSIAFEYVSGNWVLPAIGNQKNTFTLDDDSFVFDEALMLEGLQLRWLKLKGLPFDEYGYTSVLDLCKAQNKSAPVLSTSPRRGMRFLDHSNVPEGSWNGA